MALILLKLVWTSTGTYGDRNDQVYGERFSAESWEFDSNTLQVVHKPFPLGGDYDYDQSSGSTIGPPQDVSLPTSPEFYHFVLGPVRRGYSHNGAGGFTVEVLTLVATATTTVCNCAGDHTGHIDVTASGSPGPYTYKWEDKVTTEDRIDVNAGVHTVTITDTTTGQVLVQSFTVAENPPIVIVAQLGVSTIDVQVNGGTAPFTYRWDDGTTGPNRTNVSAGTYTVTVTDSLGCTNTKTIYFETSRFFFSRNPVVLPLQATQLSVKPNLRFLCEVFIEEDYLSDTFVSVAGVLRQPADAQGRTVFDVSTLLDAYVEPDFPAFGESGLVRADKTFKRFYLQYSEDWDGANPPTYVQRDTFYLVYGGLDFFEYASQAYFTDYRPRVRPFLTWEPTDKEVFADQPEYLFYHHNEETSFYFQVLVTLTNAQGVRTTRQLAEQTDAERFTVWRIGVGLPQLLAALRPAIGPDVVGWEVSVANAAGVPINEIRYFTLDAVAPPFRRYFLFANSVGGVNTLACRGKTRREVDFESQLIERTLQYNYLADAGETFTTSTTGRPTMKVNTGYRTPEQMEALQDLHLSEEVRFVDTDRYRPGSIENQTIALSDDDEAHQAVEFSFVLPKLHRYTPALRLNP